MADEPTLALDPGDLGVDGPHWTEWVEYIPTEEERKTLELGDLPSLPAVISGVHDADYVDLKVLPDKAPSFEVLKCPRTEFDKPQDGFWFRPEAPK